MQGANGFADCSLGSVSTKAASERILNSALTSTGLWASRIPGAAGIVSSAIVLPTVAIRVTLAILIARASATLVLVLALVLVL